MGLNVAGIVEDKLLLWLLEVQGQNIVIATRTETRLGEAVVGPVQGHLPADLPVKTGLCREGNYGMACVSENGRKNFRCVAEAQRREMASGTISVLSRLPVLDCRVDLSVYCCERWQ
jgi:hypothetical protein